MCDKIRANRQCCIRSTPRRFFWVRVIRTHLGDLLSVCNSIWSISARAYATKQPINPREKESQEPAVVLLCSDILGQRRSAQSIQWVQIDVSKLAFLHCHFLLVSVILYARYILSIYSAMLLCTKDKRVGHYWIYYLLVISPQYYYLSTSCHRTIQWKVFLDRQCCCALHSTDSSSGSRERRVGPDHKKYLMLIPPDNRERKDSSWDSTGPSGTTAAKPKCPVVVWVGRCASSW